MRIFVEIFGKIVLNISYIDFLVVCEGVKKWFWLIFLKEFLEKKYGLVFFLMWSNFLLVINCVIYFYEFVVVIIEWVELFIFFDWFLLMMDLYKWCDL